MDFVDWLRENLSRNGWTQEEFAVRANIPYSTFNAYLSRKTKPMPDKLRGFSDATGTSMRRLMIMCGFMNEGDFRTRSLSSSEEDLLHWWSEVPPDRKPLVLAMLRGTIPELAGQSQEPQREDTSHGAA